MTYEGFEVLELNYDRVGTVEERLSRKFVLLDPKTGKRTADEHSPSPAAVRPFTWTALGRDEITTMREFIDTRKGQAIPFWLPSFQWDLSLSEDVLEDASTVSVEWVRYVQQMWGTTGARRHIALWTLNIGSMDYYSVTDSNDPLDYVTESLTIDPIAVQNYDMETTVVSFLKLCRLDSDRVTVEHLSGSVAQATIRVREIPLESPV
jgi:hypothetical protein